MARFGRSDDLREAEFVGADLRGARFVESDLTGVVMRGVEVRQVDIDAPWLPFGGFLKVNGVDVIAFVEAELDKQFPGRAQRTAADPESLRAAWAALQEAWDAALDRVSGMPEGTVDVSIGNEWSFSQTLRHLVHATDLWFGKAVLCREDALHPLGLGDSHDGTGAQEGTPPPAYDDVLAARAERVAMVEGFLATVTAEELAEERRNPHAPERPETVLSCLHTVLEEEWEHLRFALRDLDTLDDEAKAGL